MQKSIDIYAEAPETYNPLPIELNNGQLASVRKQLRQGKNLKEILSSPEYARLHISVVKTPQSFREVPFSLYGYFRWHQADKVRRTNFEGRYADGDVIVIDSPILAFLNGLVIIEGMPNIAIGAREMERVYLTLESNLRAT